ncbi:CRISPR-associated endonuclease Cas1 [candidate division WWE3 bacterium CG22_combo_CG10-13_8_21_14_all_39_12]|uniref:CRISPR-associated endonuclease Cas1 n=2 Tax=Katanobacteria TaxID=422282 RepID=A0A2M7X2S5_UNCKA|nr:MAG: CRISPR-associated endonuclease Cas1 [candidate division WWE3 bacterium CG22_combo_CG10-13_8_21_14_all_39_12]PJA40301.1 MAG: CRISPR-associated endonuclease Cas1 [candidate division WWE3 bacterium CG_4_9_14_3_um_filter_39_7]
MLTLPDFKEKKIVFIHYDRSDKDNSLKFRADNMRLYKNGKLTEQVSCYSVIAVYIVGTTSITTTLIKEAKSFGITIFFLTQQLKEYASINAVAEGNYHLRGVQYTMDEGRSLEVARRIVQNKVANQVQFFKKQKADVDLSSLGSEIGSATDLNQIRGYEGMVSAEYFKNMFVALDWRRRAPQTREDIPNLLLDVGYSMLFNFTDSLLRLFGFDTYKGVYHRLFFQRKSLTCDIMEPIRPLIDKQLVKSWNLRQINKKDFGYKNGSFYIKDWDRRKKYVGIFLNVLMENKEEIYRYVHGYYQHVLNPESYDFQEYKIL